MDGYRFGVNNTELIKANLSISGVTTDYSARVVMDGTQGTSLEKSGEKIYNVEQSAVGVNSITSSIFTLSSDHRLSNGESIRIISDNGHLPDGLEPNTIYF